MTDTAPKDFAGCATCAFWVCSQKLSPWPFSEGRCRKHAPVENYFWPHTDAGNWCGEWQEDNPEKRRRRDPFPEQAEKAHE